MSAFLEGLGKALGKVSDQFQGRIERLKNEKKGLEAKRDEILRANMDITKKKRIGIRLIVSALLLPGLILSTGCWGAKRQINSAPKEITHWVGDKESIIKYLGSPYAQAERYYIEAIR